MPTSLEHKEEHVKNKIYITKCLHHNFEQFKTNSL